MSKYYDIRKLKELNDKLYHFILQRRKYDSNISKYKKEKI